MAAEAPSAQIGPASDLEMATPEVTGYTASQKTKRGRAEEQA